MKLDVATVVPGTETPAGDGANGAMRCVLVLPDRTRRAGVLKRGPLGQIAAEAFCALVLRAWGLSVPQPYLVVGEAQLAFASADVGYPNLKQYMGATALPPGPMRDAATLIMAKLVSQFSSTSLAAACDEAIDNRDRNLGNILWDGNGETWIDHAFAVGQGAHLPDRNKLCDMAAGSPFEDRISRGAIAQGLLLGRDCPDEVHAQIVASPIGDQGHAPFVAARLASLSSRLTARFPRPADLLSNA